VSDLGAKYTERTDLKCNKAGDTEIKKLLEIAKRDSRVQELVEREDYQVAAIGRIVGVGQQGNHDESVAILTLEVKERYYNVTIDLGSETVQLVEERVSG